jgi:hypothetical protein
MQYPKRAPVFEVVSSKGFDDEIYSQLQDCVNEHCNEQVEEEQVVYNMYE